MAQFDKILSGGDLRSIGEGNSVILKVKNQNDFDELFSCLFHSDRLVAMRAADAIEKITIHHPGYLNKHKKAIIGLSHGAKNKELKWHLALLLSRLPLNNKEFPEVWDTLLTWANDRKNSRIVSVNAIQGLFELTKQDPRYIKSFDLSMDALEKESIPSINARIKKLRKQRSLST